MDHRDNIEKAANSQGLRGGYQGGRQIDLPSQRVLPAHITPPPMSPGQVYRSESDASASTGRCAPSAARPGFDLLCVQMPDHVYSASNARFIHARCAGMLQVQICASTLQIALVNPHCVDSTSIRQLKIPADLPTLEVPHFFLSSHW